MLDQIKQAVGIAVGLLTVLVPANLWFVTIISQQEAAKVESGLAAFQTRMAEETYDIAKDFMYRSEIEARVKPLEARTTRLNNAVMRLQRDSGRVDVLMYQSGCTSRPMIEEVVVDMDGE